MAKFDWILTTDADCSLPPGILKAYSNTFSGDRVLLVSGPVKIGGQPDNFWHRFQSLEFMCLNGTGGASIRAGMPLMCNGANLCFRKSLFLEAFEAIHPDFNGGEDMFLLEYTVGTYPGKIDFLKSRDALVETLPAKDLSEFFKQRAKWASKAPLYRNPDLVRVAILVWLMNAWFFVLLAGLLFHLNFLMLIAVWLVLKSWVNYSFIRKLVVFYGNKEVMKFYLLSELVYPFYIVGSSLGGLFRYFKIRQDGR